MNRIRIGLASILLIYLAKAAIAQEVKPILPIDDFVVRKSKEIKWVLPYPSLREADILWEKRIWREIDTREKMNLIFSYPEMPLSKILIDAALRGEIKTYSAQDDKFNHDLALGDLRQMIHQSDTVEVVDPETYEVFFKPIENDFDYTAITKYRIKEVWYFDTRSSQMKVRILGVAPIKSVYDDQGNFKYETPIFWVYYPHIRELLASYAIFNPKHDKTVMSWEDLFEVRFFSSYITKQSNIRDGRLQDRYAGVELLEESEKIKQEIFNFEHDLWSY